MLVDAGSGARYCRTMKTSCHHLRRVHVLAVVAGFALLAPALLSAGGGAEQPAERAAERAADRAATITVIGRGELFAEPDQAAITVGVQLYHTSAQAAAAELRERMDAVIAAVLALGVPERHVQTMNYSIFFERDYQAPPGPRDQDGRPGGTYRVENMVRLVLSDVTRAAAVVEAAIHAGANQMYGIEFSFSDPGPLEEQARTLAMEDAYARALALAVAGGRTVGEVLEITESAGAGPGPYDVRTMNAGYGGGGPVQPGSARYTANVQVTYELR